MAAKTASGPTVAVVGVTGAVGQEFLTVCACAGGSDDRPLSLRTSAGAQGKELPIQRHQAARLRKVRACFAAIFTVFQPHPSSRSAGKKQEFDGHTYTIEELTENR